MIDKNENSVDLEQQKNMEDQDNNERSKHLKRDILGDVTKMTNSETFLQGSKQNKNYGFSNPTSRQLDNVKFKYFVDKKNHNIKDCYYGELKKNKYYAIKNTNERNKQGIDFINENKENKIDEYVIRNGGHCCHSEVDIHQRTKRVHDDFDFVTKLNYKEETKLHIFDEKQTDSKLSPNIPPENCNQEKKVIFKQKKIEISDKVFHLEPYWDKSIINELNFIKKKYKSYEFESNDVDKDNIYMISEYASGIYNYLHTLEVKLAPDPNYMSKQKELNLEMRIVLVDWVVQVHRRFNMLSETLFLAVNIIDRFLSKKNVSSSRFQLVGAIALFIAAKYEEVNCPTVQEVAYMTDNIYSVDDFLKAEKYVIEVLEFDMGWPGPLTFLRRILKGDNYNFKIRILTKYFLETTIMDPNFIGSQPSWLAAGSYYLSKRMLKSEIWSDLNIYFSGFTERQLIPLAERLLENCCHPLKNHNAIFEKYNDKKYCYGPKFVQDYLNILS